MRQSAPAAQSAFAQLQSSACGAHGFSAQLAERSWPPAVRCTQSCPFGQGLRKQSAWTGRVWFFPSAEAPGLAERQPISSPSSHTSVSADSPVTCPPASVLIEARRTLPPSLPRSSAPPDLRLSCQTERALRPARPPRASCCNASHARRFAVRSAREAVLLTLVARCTCARARASGGSHGGARGQRSVTP